jgi:hypothetical protein
MASSTFTITRETVFTDGRRHSAVEATGFTSKKDAEDYLGLALYFPYTRDNERVVNFVITRD